MTNKNNTVLYTGVTSDLYQRVYNHKKGIYESSFTKRYNINKLVYYNFANDIESAINYEKKLKSGSRKKKVELIEKMNPYWNDLSSDFYTNG